MAEAAKAQWGTYKSKFPLSDAAEVAVATTINLSTVYPGARAGLMDGTNARTTDAMIKKGKRPAPVGEEFAGLLENSINVEMRYPEGSEEELYMGLATPYRFMAKERGINGAKKSGIYVLSKFAEVAKGEASNETGAHTVTLRAGNNEYNFTLTPGAAFDACASKTALNFKDGKPTPGLTYSAKQIIEAAERSGRNVGITIGEACEAGEQLASLVLTKEVAVKDEAPTSGLPTGQTKSGTVKTR